jgi:hypothetical protein
MKRRSARFDKIGSKFFEPATIETCFLQFKRFFGQIFFDPKIISSRKSFKPKILSIEKEKESHGQKKYISGENSKNPFLILFNSKLIRQLLRVILVDFRLRSKRQFSRYLTEKIKSCFNDFGQFFLMKF